MGRELAGGGWGAEPQGKVPSLDVSQYLGLQHSHWEPNWSQLQSLGALPCSKSAAAGCWDMSLHSP